MTAVDALQPPQQPQPEATASASNVVRQSQWLAASGVVVGLVNYAYSLAMTRLLAPGLFADFAAAQSLLLVCGTLATSSMPWVVSRVLADPTRSGDERQQAIWFSFVVNLAQGLTAALVICAIGARFLDAGSLAAVAVASVAIFLITTPGGWLQGTARFGQLAFFRVLEVVVKLGVGVALVLAGGSDTGALAAVAAGALVVVAAGLVLMRAELRYTPGALRVRSLWQNSLGNVAVQGLVAVMASTDVVLVAVLDGGSPASGSYQASSILARVPVFLAGALAAAAFPTLVAHASAARQVRTASTATYAWLAGAYALALVCAPAVLVGFVFPGSYALVDEVLPWAALAGLLMGAINLVTTFFQAPARYGFAIRVLAVASVAHLVLLYLGWAVDDVTGVAIVSPVVPAVAVGVLLGSPVAHLARPSLRTALRVAALVTLATGALVLARPWWPVWLVVAAAVGLLALRRALPTTSRRPRQGAHRRTPTRGAGLR
jgi:O-antigen/teichoic acid export membrane protein